jgi:FlaA1/EpsC-like NDP-sugar epimerase
MDKMFSKKRILVTGACGTVGKELIRQLLKSSDYTPSEVLGVDNNESEIFFLDQEYLEDSRANFFLGDLRDKDTLIKISKGVDIIFHAAALKHVVLCERSPFEAVQTNILGVQNVISAAFENNVERVIFTSSDKAVNPTNVMGTSKLMGERLITAANSSSYSCDTPIFASTRFGNVLGSNGSVIPIFRKQIQIGGPVTLTDDAMTRFVMTVEQSARLVLESASLAKGGEVFITKMPVIKISTLAEAMIEELAEGFGYKVDEIKVEVIGSKPGEKLYEELMSDEETRRSVELDDYFSVLPAFRGMYSDIDYSYESLQSDEITNPYNSAKEKHLSKDELKTFLLDNNLLGSVSEDVKSQRYWPGDKN